MLLKNILDNYKSDYKDIKLHISEVRKDKYINIDLIVIPETYRSEGLGTKIVGDIVEYAKEKGSTICITPAKKVDFKTFNINAGGLKRFWSKDFSGFKFVQNSGRNKDYEISASMYMEVDKVNDINLDFINNVKRKDKYDEDVYESIEDKYLNGECETLVGYLTKLNKRGVNCEIHLIDESLDDDDSLYELSHSVYKDNKFYYDINGRFNNLDMLIRELPYYQEHMTIKIQEYDVAKSEHYKDIPKHLQDKDMNKINKKGLKI